jgi:inward rectifier potassium channel
VRGWREEASRIGTLVAPFALPKARPLVGFARLPKLGLASKKPRLFTRRGRVPIEVVGSRSATFRDLYHFLLGATWGRVIGALSVLFLVSNALFAVAYLLTDGIAGARPNSFWDAFFFSVQTMGTIGYGTMSPKNFAGNVLVTLEAMVGLLGLAIATGLVFAKFSKPKARVLFSRVAVIGERDGIPTLMFRVANERSSHVVEANIRAAVLRQETTAEGERFRRIHYLDLVRSQSPVFVLSWTVLHQIKPGSPFYGATPQSVAQQEAEIVVTLTGIDETLSQNIHTRYSYGPEDIRWNARLADIFETAPDGRQRLDFSKFHDIVEAPPTPTPSPSGRGSG